MLQASRLPSCRKPHRQGGSGSNQKSHPVTHTSALEPGDHTHPTLSAWAAPRVQVCAVPSAQGLPLPALADPPLLSNTACEGALENLSLHQQWQQVTGTRGAGALHREPAAPLGTVLHSRLATTSQTPCTCGVGRHVACKQGPFTWLISAQAHLWQGPRATPCPSCGSLSNTTSSLKAARIL